MAISSRVKDLYKDMYADGGERAWRDVGAVDKTNNIARVWALAHLPQRATVVEIGCGEGAIADALQKRRLFSNYRGFDLSESGIAEANLRQVSGAQFARIEGDIIPVEDDDADVVILSHVVEHPEHPRVLLYEARRIARRVIVEVPLESNVRTPRDYVWDELGHINKYTATTIRHLVQTCGLIVEEQVTTNPSRDVALFMGASLKRRINWILKQQTLAVAPALARALFTYHETILAQRAG